MSDRRLRVLALTPDYPPAVGGIQLLFHRVLKHAHELDIRVVTIAPPQWTADDGGADDGDVVRAPSLYDHRLDVLAMNALALREARRFRPDLVFSAHIVAAPAAALIARRFSVPTVLYTHAKEVGTRGRLARFAVRNSTAVIAVSRYTQSLVLAAGAEERRVHVISPGVDIVEPSGVSRRSRPTILTVARLEDRYKGHDTMVRALPLVRGRIPDVEWVVLGDGQLRGELEELARANDAERSVVFLGGVSDTERNRWLDSSHVFAMPSRLPAGAAAGEGFGIVYLEAGVHGLPVVAGNVGGAVDAVVHGHTGLLVDPTSPLALADALTELLSDPVRAQRMGAAGALRARDFTWASVSRRVQDLLTSVGQGHRTTPVA